MRSQPWLAGTLIVSLLLAAFASFAPQLDGKPAVVAAPAAQTTNYIFNPGFEDAGNNTTGNGWSQWWQETPRPSDGSFNYAFRPSWNVEKLSSGAAPELVFAGNNSQRVINNWDPWYAGVKQVISAPAGSRVRLTAYARVWTASSNWPTPSDTSVGVKVQVGLEPNGSDNQFASSVIWSGAAAPHNGWQPISVDATVGSGGRVGVFLSADYRGYSRLFMGAFFDEVSLVVISSSGGPNPPTATNTRTVTPTLGPTSTGTLTPSRTPTITPTPTRTGIPPTVTLIAPETYVVKRGDTLSAIARRFGLSLAALMAANNIRDPNRIFVGQVLIIRGGNATPDTTVVYYTVVSGDNLSRIARRYRVTVAQLKLWNNLQSDVIYPGQRLIVGP